MQYLINFFSCCFISKYLRPGPGPQSGVSFFSLNTSIITIIIKIFDLWSFTIIITFIIIIIIIITSSSYYNSLSFTYGNHKVNHTFFHKEQTQGNSITNLSEDQYSLLVLSSLDILLCPQFSSYYMILRLSVQS